MTGNRAPLYRIRDWDKHFENAESKRAKDLKWVKMPNKHDGKGYRRLVRKNPMHYAAWVLLVQVASKCPERGTLADEDGPLTTEDIAIKTDIPKDIFDAALPVLVNEIKWVEAVNQRQSTTINDNQRQSTTVDKKREEKRREEKRRKEKKSPSPPPTAAALLCDTLRNCILEKDPSTKVPKNAWSSKVGWGKEARLLLEADGRPAEEAEKLIRWATSDSFWQRNILSMGKFREQYDRLKRQCLDIPKKDAIDRELEVMENE